MASDLQTATTTRSTPVQADAAQEPRPALGFVVKHFVADGEPAQSFEQLVQRLVLQFPPRNVIEEQKVLRLTELIWKLRRYRAFEIFLLNSSNSVDLGLPTSLTKSQPTSVNDRLEWSKYLDACVQGIWKEINRIVEDLETDQMRPAKPMTIEAKAGVDLGGEKTRHKNLEP